MASLSFTKVNNKIPTWEATISSVEGTITVDLERTKIGAVSVLGKLSGSTAYKLLGNVAMANNSPGVIFNIANDSDSAALAVKIVSYSQVTSGSYE